MNSTPPRILAVNGSPKHLKSNTEVMLSAFLEGARERNASVETVYLAKQNITPCCGELKCWRTRARQCVYTDDMQTLIPKLENIDYLVLAFPLYFDAMPGILKLFLERLLPMGTPFMEKDNHGEYLHTDLPGVTTIFRKPPKIIILCNAGFPEQSNFEVIRVWARRIARNLHTEIAGEIYRGMGALLTLPAPGLKPVVARYRIYLKRAAIDILDGKAIPPALRQRLEADLMPRDAYVEQINTAAKQNWGVSSPF